LDKLPLIQKYKQFIQRLAVRYAKSYQIEPVDLMQEGTLAVLEAHNLLDKTKTIEEMDSFIKQHIKWAMLTYIAINYCAVAVQKNKFFSDKTPHSEQLQSDDMFITLAGTNPEDLFVLFEEKSNLDELIQQFEETITDDKEKYIWYHVVKTDEPVTTREAAAAIGVSSNKTVTNIKQRLEKRFEEFYCQL